MGMKKASQPSPRSKVPSESQSKDRGPVVRKAAKQEVETPAPAEPREDAHGVVCVDPTGDIVLAVRSDSDEDSIAFRVNSRPLIAHSAYFKRLLEDTRFNEGALVAKTLEQVRQQFGDPANAPSNQLPRLEIQDLGRTSPIRSIRPIMMDFLLVLHNGELAARKLPLTNLTNLAIVADRFDATAAFGHWVRMRGVLVRPKALSGPMSEEVLRQRLLLGLLFRDSELVLAHTHDLILKGSPLWADVEKAPVNDALWWDLPHGIEEELQHRRNAILRTTWSLLHACLEAYTGRTRQCRLGYDSSLQCDSFQLGEFVRFLSRSGHLQFASALSPGDGPASAPATDVAQTIATLRACPSYQIDANHSHCGPRKMLTAGLAAIDALLTESDIGVCFECWSNRRNTERSWEEGRPALLFDVAKMPRAGPRAREPLHVHSGNDADLSTRGTAAGLAKELFMAKERRWSAESPTLAMRGGPEGRELDRHTVGMLP